MIVLSDRRSQVILLERREWAVLKDVAAILDIIPSFLVDMTGRLVQLDSRFDTNVSQGRHGSGFDRGGINFVIDEYHRAVCVWLGIYQLKRQRGVGHTSSAWTVTSAALQPQVCLSAPACVRTRIVEALDAALYIPVQPLVLICYSHAPQQVPTSEVLTSEVQCKLMRGP
jgi:hypothetical protein